MDLATHRKDLKELREMLIELKINLTLKNLQIRKERGDYSYLISQKALIQQQLAITKNMIQLIKDELSVLSRI